MASVRCPHCNIPNTASEAKTGICAACGESLRSKPGELPPRKSYSAASPAMPPMAPSPTFHDSTPRLLTVAVNPALWPPGRYLVQSVASAILIPLGVLLLVLFPSPIAAGLVGGVATGLTVAGCWNGILVARRGRRFTFLGVLAMIGAFFLVGLAVQPGLSLTLRAGAQRWQGNIEKLRAVKLDIEAAGNDVRIGPARAIAEGGLRDAYADVLGRLSQPVPEGADPAFRDAFREWIEILSTRGSCKVTVDLDEQIDETVPPLAIVDLALWKQNIAQPPKLADQFHKGEHSAHVRDLVSALRRRFDSVLPAKLLDWSPDAAGGARIEFRGQVTHSGRHLQHMFLQRGLPIGASLKVAPNVAWNVSLIDATGQPRGTIRLDVPYPENASWKEPVGQGFIPISSPILGTLYGKTAWDLARKIGLADGPAPTTYP